MPVPVCDYRCSARASSTAGAPYAVTQRNNPAVGANGASAAIRERHTPWARVRPLRARCDLKQVLAIADRRRHQCATYQPQFWNPGPDAANKQRDFFTSRVDDPQKLFAVAVTDLVQGFVIAAIGPTPPVYDPGGLTCLIDDFTVDAPDSWLQIGPRLLPTVRSWADDRGAVQLVVVTAGAKRCWPPWLRDGGPTRLAAVTLTGHPGRALHNGWLLTTCHRSSLAKPLWLRRQCTFAGDPLPGPLRRHGVVRPSRGPKARRASTSLLTARRYSSAHADRPS
jgi:GNAT superfamily N-acetyltransferase